MLSPIPGLDRSLSALGDILRKAEAHCDAGHIAHDTLLAARLAPSMKPLTHQIRLACDTAIAVGFGLAGLPAAPVDGPYAGFADLQDRLAATRVRLGGLAAESFAQAETRRLSAATETGGDAIPGWIYLTQYGLPNFYFAMTTAYAILRNQGVPLGKVDFLGPEDSGERR